MRLVLDSSVAFKWVVPEVHSDKALRLRDAARKAVHTFLTPDVFFPELANPLTCAERQKRIPVSTAATLLLDVLSTPPAIVPAGPLLLRLRHFLAGKGRLLRLPLRRPRRARGTPKFVTADDKLVKNLQPQFPFILALSSMP